MKGIKPNFGAFDQSQYRNRAGTPSHDIEYFNKFHRPLIDKLGQKFGAPLRVLSIACGYGHELEFFKDDARLRITGIDMSKDMIEDDRKRFPGMEFAIVDVSRKRPPTEAFEGAIGVNAMIYCPDKMGNYAFRSIRPGGLAVINFTDASREENRPYFEACKQRGTIDEKMTLEVKGKKFELLVMDYTKREDICKNAGKQMFFTGRRCIEDFLGIVGFEIVLHGKYVYGTLGYNGILMDVYTLAKPIRA
ncbi:MAG: class I SAM-dependent methyltransferase [Candidatus Micrarchaeia archaeon]|jgi:SAM-dependent methyltransferase